MYVCVYVCVCVCVYINELVSIALLLTSQASMSFVSVPNHLGSVITVAVEYVNYSQR